MKKNILIVAADSKPGGVTVALMNWCRILLSRGHAVTLLNLAADDSGFADLDPCVERIYLGGLARRWQLGPADIREAGGVLARMGLLVLGGIKKLTTRLGCWLPLVWCGVRPIEGYDVVFAFRQGAPCYEFVCRKTQAPRKLAFIHGERAYMGDIRSWSRYFPRFDAVACVSDYARGEFAAEFPALAERFVCVYNTFDTDAIRQKAACTVAALPVTEHGIIRLVTVARVENFFKQIDWIPRVARLIRDAGVENFDWHVVGDGPDLEADRALAEELGVGDRVVFVGFQSNPFPYVKAADLFVLPSRSEAYAMVVKEAQVLGIPVLSTHYSSAYEAIRPEIDGYIAGTTPESLAEALIQLMADQAVALRRLQASTRAEDVTNDRACAQLEALL